DSRRWRGGFHGRRFPQRDDLHHGLGHRWNIFGRSRDPVLPHLQRGHGKADERERRGVHHHRDGDARAHGARVGPVLPLMSFHCRPPGWHPPAHRPARAPARPLIPDRPTPVILDLPNGGSGHTGALAAASFTTAHAAPLTLSPARLPPYLPRRQTGVLGPNAPAEIIPSEPDPGNAGAGSPPLGPRPSRPRTLPVHAPYSPRPEGSS